jgi:hypothetical protein
VEYEEERTTTDLRRPLLQDLILTLDGNVGFESERNLRREPILYGLLDIVIHPRGITHPLDGAESEVVALRLYDISRDEEGAEITEVLEIEPVVEEGE